MCKGSKKIGICGGTFDPIHIGHLILAQEIKEKFALDTVLFIPSGTPPHKPLSKVTEVCHRFAMVGMAIKGNPGFAVSSIEVDRNGYTYTIDTLKELKRIYGENADLFFITGADVIPELVTWKEFEKVFTMCEFISAFRPGMDKQAFISATEHLGRTYGARIHTVEVPLIEVSSTGIREKVFQGKCIRYLVPDSVEQYIYNHKLYLG